MLRKPGAQGERRRAISPGRLTERILEARYGARHQLPLLLDRQLEDALVVDAVVAELPEAWLDLEEQRQAYRAYLQARLEDAAFFVEEAQHARAQLI